MNTLRRHRLLTKALAETLPPLYANDGLGYDAPALIHFFSPYSGWDWYATEFDPETETFFGLVKGDFTELGYFTLAELESAAFSNGVPIVERDLHWYPRPLSEVR